MSIVAASMLIANAGVALLVKYKLLESMPRGAGVATNIVTAVFLSILRQRASAQPAVTQPISTPTPACDITWLNQGDAIRRDQYIQVVRALGANDRPHAVVVGCSERELEEILAFGESPSVFLLRWSKRCQLLSQKKTLDWLQRGAQSICYLSDLTSLSEPGFGAFLSTCEQHKIRVVVRGDADGSFELQRFKLVHLIPLTESACLESANWSSYTTEKVAVKIAVAAAFLLRGGNGTEMELIKDILERAGAAGQRKISVDQVWNVFKEMHYADTRMRSRPDEFAESPAVMPLFMMSTILKKRYDVTLPVEGIGEVHPPEFLTDLNAQLKEQDLCVNVIDSHLADLGDALSGQYHNALILGEAGCGKTTLVKTAAWLSAKGTLHDNHPLYGKTIYEMSLAEFMGGTKYKGILEGRVASLFHFLMHTRNAVLFVDEIHLAIGAGASDGNAMGTVGQFFKTYLEQEGVMVIGATTMLEYRRWVGPDTAFVRRFNQVQLPDPESQDIANIFNTYIGNASYKKLCPDLVLSAENMQQVCEIVQQEGGEIGRIDRGKKLLEAIAKAARRKKVQQVDSQLIEQCAAKSSETT